MEPSLGTMATAQKFDIKVKSKPKDGLILQLHHTVRKSNGENKRIRFSTGCFDDAHEKLACADNGGNIFLLDFIDLKFWKVTNHCPCTAIQFIPDKPNSIIIATDVKFTIDYLDTESGDTSLTLTGHTAPVKHIAFSNNKIKNLLTASAVEAILWEVKSHTKYFTLTTYSCAQIQQIMFAPTSDYLVACFQNDTIQIWRQETMKSVKQIIPNDLKHMKTIAFSTNGRAMAMAGLTPLLILFSMNTWKAIKSIDLMKFNICGVQQVAFIPQMFDGGSNKVLAILSSDCILHFLDLELLVIIHCIHPETSGVRKIEVSPTGKYFLCILQLGEVNIYNTSYVLDMAERKLPENTKQEIPCSSTHKSIPKTHLKHVGQHEMKTCMDSGRLRRILLQQREYPEKFRSMIWKSLLSIPKNKKAYSILVNKGTHASYKDIEKLFTIHSTATLKTLKTLLSCLAHWCPLFGVTKFLPGFVFPFVKVLQKEPVLLFECVATVLLNQCQLWFEYAPFPPISVLAMVENVLAEHDQKLLDHFCQHGVTSQIYALAILETAFSEILSSSEWLILWDHILSNEPAFIIMAVVSYSIVQRNVIRKITSLAQLEKFFHSQNPIDMKMLLKKTYSLLKYTPDDIHPKQFFKSFEALKKGSCYQLFNGYPKATICLKLAKKERHKTKEYKERRLKKSHHKHHAHRSKYNDSSCSGSENSVDVDISMEKNKKQTNKISILQKGIKEELIDSIMHPQPTCIKSKNNIEKCSYESLDSNGKYKVKASHTTDKKKVKKQTDSNSTKSGSSN